MCLIKGFLMYLINQILDIKSVIKWISLYALWMICLASVLLIACGAVPIEYIPVEALDETSPEPTKQASQKASQQASQLEKNTREIQRVAVLELKDQSNGMIKEEERIYLSNLIRQTVGLLPQDQYPVMTQENILTLLPEGKSLEDCLKDCEISIGRELGAHYIITGEVIRFGDALRLMLKLHESKSGTLKNSDSISGTQVEDLEKLLKAKTIGLFKDIIPNFQDLMSQFNQGIKVEKIIYQPSIDPTKIITTPLSTLEEIDLPTSLKFEIKDLDYGSINLNALEAYDKAVLRESQFKHSPQSRKEAWQDLLKIEKDSQLAILAQDRVNTLEKIVLAEKYHLVKRVDQSNQHPIDKIEAWKSLMNHPKYEKQAQKRIAEWEEILKISPIPYFNFKEIYQEISKQHEERKHRLYEDWNKLSRVLKLAMISQKDKSTWVNEFIEKFGVLPTFNPHYQALEGLHSLSQETINRIRTENLEELNQKLKILKSFPLEFWDHHSDDVWDIVPNEMIEAQSIPLPSRVFPQSVSLNGVEFIRIDGGVFLFGENKVRTRIKPFYISKTEITVAQYQNCVDAGVCEKGYDAEYCNWKSDQENLPFNCIPFQLANRYASWINGTLPSQEQWEYTAKSQGQNLKYPWGDTPKENCDYSVLRCEEKEGASSVCSKTLGHTKQGVCDMMGNLSEWLSNGSLRGSNFMGDDAEWQNEINGDLLVTTNLSLPSQKYMHLKYAGFRVVLTIATSF